MHQRHDAVQVQVRDNAGKPVTNYTGAVSVALRSRSGWLIVDLLCGLAVLTAAATVSPSFIADKAGTYIVQLVVNDGTVDSAADQAVVHVVSNQRPTADSQNLRTAQETPRNDRERAVAAIWEEALGVRGVGVHDNFFDLGGHSLLLPKVLTKVRALTEQEVSMVDLFRYPTVHALAAALDDPRGPQGAVAVGEAAP